MVAITYDHEVISSIPPARLFNAFIVNGDELIPKVLPQAIKSVEILEGDGGAGSIKVTTFGEGSQFKSVKQQVEALDKENYVYKYSVIEGDALQDVVEKVSYEVQILPSSGDGGSICKTKSTYHTKGDAQISEDDIKAGKEKAGFLFKAVEAYLIAHPDLY
ncbi:OLC1v1020648C1 [Oldenlandia corymbosa var. corymbosa]|uniref:OLC1v1020648C1 n=1 Tax=Oldenlandia corymbosa var. corymbosa TaxID=529605 RepID=A0AAV1EGW2_OLDCO|nr:OLC1v1020648C1 [Oldenlandia corymbosa var. corymbosa]